MSAEQSRLVCVVEDDADVRASVKLLFEVSGYRVIDFASAEAFLHASDGRDAACMVFDQYMEGMTGLDLLECLRLDGIQTPVIIVTASRNDLYVRCARAGALALLHKPSAPSEMLAWVARACGPN